MTQSSPWMRRARPPAKRRPLRQPQVRRHPLPPHQRHSFPDDISYADSFGDTDSVINQHPRSDVNANSDIDSATTAAGGMG